MPPRVYIEDTEFHMSPDSLPDDLYEQAISSLVIVCADALFVNRAMRTVFLARRTVKPMTGLWFLGGRLQAGEQADVGMARILKRETSLALPAERFKFLAMHRYFFKDRKQEPQDKGCDTLAFTFFAEIQPDELTIATVHLTSDEYDTSSGFKEYNRDALIAEGARQAIIDAYDSVFPSKS